MMHKVLGVCVVVLMLTGLGRAEAPQLPSVEGLNASGLELVWHAQVSLDAQRDAVQEMAFDGETLFLQTNRGLVQAIQESAADRGAEVERTAYRRSRRRAGSNTIWINQIGKEGLISFRPATNKTLLFVVNGSQLYAMDKKSGRLMWQFRLPNVPSAPLAATETHVYLGFVDGSFRAYDIEKKAISWFAKTGETIGTAALPVGGMVAYASENGILYLGDAVSRDLIFQFETDRPVSAALSSLRDEEGLWLFVASEDQTVFSIGIPRGRTRWQRSLGDAIYRPLVSRGEDLFVSPEGSGIHCLDVRDGQEKWNAKSARDVIAVGADRVYAHDKSHRLVTLDRSSGKVMGRIDMRSYNRVVTNLHDSRIYLSTRTGLVICLQEIQEAPSS